MLARLKAAAAARLRHRLGIDALERGVAELEGAVVRDIGQAWKLLDGHEDRLGRIERLVRTATVMAWIEQATLRTAPLVSVVVPTRDRASLLPRAIESVLAQSYGEWELLVCDDGSRDGTAALLAEVEDPRVRHLPAEAAGVAAARNRGIEAAGGELIAYLDDDNRMHPNWLKSVVWAFEQRPETELLYGGIVIEDTGRLHREPAREMPSAWLERYDPETILSSNVADTSAIAHRAGLAEARFDERLQTMGDWDLFLRLSAEREPLTLPAIACFYFTDAEGRMSDLTEAHAVDRGAIRDRALRQRSRA